MFNIFKNFTKKEFFLIFFCLILVIVQVFLELKIPDYMSSITTLVQTKESTMSEILKQGTYMLLCAFGSLVSMITVGYLAAFVSSGISRTLRKKVFEKVQSFSTAEIKKFSTSSLITRTTNDVTQIEMLISMGLQMIIKSPIMATWAIIKIIDKSIEWSMLTGGCVLILLLTIIFLMLIVLPKFEKIQKLIDKINGVTRENLTGIRVIRAFNAEQFQEKRFEKINTELTQAQLFNQRCFAILSPIMNLVLYGLNLGIYLIGAYLINAAGMVEKITLFSNMIVFSSYAMQVIMSFLMLAVIFIMWPRASISARRINEVIDTECSILNGNFSEESKIHGTIEFKNVYFKYPDADEYLLENISFKINKGETAAFIGSTGSGKSSLINLIPRFYDVTDGEILIDGVNIKEYDLTNLRNKIGYVPQKAVMFSTSIIDNVRYGDNGKTKPNLNKIKEAIKIAQGTEFVEKMEDGYNSEISRGGTNISGGQKQRLAIARAIARNPEIYIFDDSFSALDYKTDAILRSELKKYTKEATSLIVAQRIGTIMNADKIFVFDEGKCVGSGTHKELLKTCKIYKEIALSQLSKEELENATNA